ncbi:MAG: DUF6151 family protein [Myxococcota bacterium]
MTTDLMLRCRCGELRGRASGLAPSTATQLICYCADCQAFARWLGRDDILDERGGSAIFQMPPAQVTFTAGADRLACVRLSDKGMHRWYAACCRTPIGNTMGPRMAFIGLLHNFIELPPAGPERDAVFGKPIRVHGRSAIGGRPPDAPATIAPGAMVKFLFRFVSWSLSGGAQPSPVFTAERRPRATPEVLSATERARLRPIGAAPDRG